MMDTLRLITVIPCYNEEVVVGETYHKIIDLYGRMIEECLISNDSKLLFVDDGSADNTWSMIMSFHEQDNCVCGVKLASNVGQQNALLAGFSLAVKEADVLVSIDADLQDDIHVIPEMINKSIDGYDIVYGVRRKRTSDTWFKRTTAQTFYRLMKWLGVSTVYNHADFRLMSRRAVIQLLKYRERNLFLRGLVPLVGYKSTNVYYDRAERFAGKSKYSVWKMLNFALDGITSFSNKPVRMVLSIGLFFLLVAFGMFCYVIFRLVTGQTVEGWASLMISLWFVGAFNLIGLGVIGEYVGKMYIEVKDRPRYNIEEVIN